MKKISILVAVVAAVSVSIISCGGNTKTQAEIQDSIRITDSLNMVQMIASASVVIDDAVCDTMRTPEGKMVEVTYGTLDGKKVAVLGHSDFVANDTLFQTLAWAKGAEYERGSVKLHSQGNKATLHTADGRFELKIMHEK